MAHVRRILIWEAEQIKRGLLMRGFIHAHILECAFLCIDPEKHSVNLVSTSAGMLV